MRTPSNRIFSGSRCSMVVVTTMTLISLFACQGKNSDQLSDEVSPQFDQVKSQQLGADEYGMRQYTLVLLASGENQTDDADFINEVMRGHLDNIGLLASEGKLVVGGPFMQKEPYRGLFIFATDDLDEARRWVDSDPAVQADLLRAELLPWYGSAALMEIPAIHTTIEQVTP